jgi:hypothetical protein
MTREQVEHVTRTFYEAMSPGKCTILLEGSKSASEAVPV